MRKRTEQNMKSCTSLRGDDERADGCYECWNEMRNEISVLELDYIVAGNCND